MRTRRLTLAGLALLLGGSVLSAFQLLPSDPGVALRALDRGSQSQVDEPQQVVVRTENEWADLWRRHAPSRARPAVDFSRDMVVGVFLGSQPTAGFGVEIVDARIDGIAMVVRYRSTRPSADALVAQVVTSPYHLVALSRHAGDVRFQKIE